MVVSVLGGFVFWFGLGWLVGVISGQVCCGCLLVTFGFVCLTMLLLSGFRLMFGLCVGWFMFALG